LTHINFIPNDISLDKKVMLLTGPNMGGKSTILRTSCLLTIMAQIGYFVPAESYKAQIIDRVFTRIGASDKL
jgi:DNA mismatch repair ATPase MutS